MVGGNWEPFLSACWFPLELRDHLFQGASGAEWLEGGYPSETKPKGMEDASTLK